MVASQAIIQRVPETLDMRRRLVIGCLACAVLVTLR
jgi:hypothetical protein